MLFRGNKYKKIALALSLWALLAWGALGAGTSLAWFTDTTPELHNIFHFAELDLAVSRRLPDGSWEPVDEQTKVFGEEALYEPGYVQVVYLKAQNKGTVPFTFHTAVTATKYNVATNYFGRQFYLHEYLKFGISIAKTQQEMDASVATRGQTKAIADMKLSSYETERATLQPGETAYIAIVVRMPEEVDNEANYRGTAIPSVALGVIVKAEQIVA